MAARVSVYSRDPLQGPWGVTQGDPISPQIFNSVVDAIVHHWFGIVEYSEAVPYGFGYMLEERAATFYAYDGLIESTNLMWLHWEFDVLISLFDWVGLRKNVADTVEMVCHPGNIDGQESAAANGQQMTGKGDLYYVNQR